MGDHLDLGPATLEISGTYAVRIRNVAGTVRSRDAVIAVRRKLGLRLLGRWPAEPDGEFANRVRVIGNLLYLAQGAAGLQILDVSDPASPRRVGGYFDGGYAGGLAIADQRLYLADGNVGGLTVLDLTHPTQPARLGRIRLDASANDVRILGNHAYVACSIKGLAVVDVSDPAQLKVVGRIPESYGASRLDLSEGWAFVADAQGGLLICRVADPTQPRPRPGASPDPPGTFRPTGTAEASGPGGPHHAARTFHRPQDLDALADESSQRRRRPQRVPHRPTPGESWRRLLPIDPIALTAEEWLKRWNEFRRDSPDCQSVR